MRSPRSFLPLCVIMSAVLGFGQPSGVLTSPFDDGSPYARLPDGASGLYSPFLSSQYHPIANPLGGTGSFDAFTGQNGYAISLGSLSARGRVSHALIAFYSGNVRLAGRDDNLTSPTSWLGLGWSLEAPYIARNHKGTFASWDDVFYADLGPIGKGQLVRGQSGAFYLADNPYLTFLPDSATNGEFAGQFESWSVLTSDGTLYVFGDRNGTISASERITYQTNGAVRASPYAIGNAATTPFLYRWDLRYISDPEQVNRILFDWQKDEVPLHGSASKFFTRGSYLKSVRVLDPRNNEAERWEFIIRNKPADEYVLPHSTTSLLGPEPIPTKYLDSIRVFQDGLESSNYTFTYALVGSGKYRKRLLDEVRSEYRLHPYTGTFYSSPGWKCTYDPIPAYRLRTVKKPAGGTTEFEYVSATLGADASQPVHDPNNNVLKNESGAVVTFPNTSSWANVSSCSERFCFLVAKDGDKVGGKIYLEVRHNGGNYFDETGIYRKTYTATSGTVASNWKWAAAGDYFVVYDANGKDVHLHEWNGVSWSFKFTADFGPVAGSSNPLSVYPARNYFVASQAGNPLNKAWVYLRRGDTWNRLNSESGCDIDNNSNYGETVKNAGYGCLEFNSNLKVAVTETFFTLHHDATDIFYVYALNRDGNAFQNVSGSFLNFGDGVQNASFPNNWNLNVTQIIPGPDYFLVQSVNGSQQRLDVLHNDGLNFRRVATSGWENGVAADLSAAAERDYFITANQSTGLLHLWRRTGIAAGFNYTRTQARSGVPARSAARLTLKAFPEAFTFEYGRLGEEFGGMPIPILEGANDLSTWLYQVDPTAAGGFRDRSPDILYTVAGGTTKLFGLSITPDNFLGGVTLRNNSSQSSVCPVGGTCKPFFATLKVQRGESGFPYLTGVKAVPDLPGPSLNKHVVFSVARSGMLSWFDGAAQRVKYRLHAFDGFDYDGAPDNIRLVSRIIEHSGVEQTGAGAGPDLRDSISYDLSGAEFNAHLQVVQFPLVTRRQIDSNLVDNGRTETRYDVDKSGNRLLGRTLRLNGTVKQKQVFKKPDTLLSSSTASYRTGSALVTPADWPASIALNRLDNTVTQDIRPKGSKMTRKVTHHNYNNANGQEQFTKMFQDDRWSISQTRYNSLGLPFQSLAFSVPYSGAQPNGPDLDAAPAGAPLNTTQAIASSKVEYDPAYPYYKLKDSLWRHEGGLTEAQRQAGTEPVFDLASGWFLAAEVTRRNALLQVEESRVHRTATAFNYSSSFYEGRKQLRAGSVENSKLENSAVLLGENGDVNGLSTPDLPGRWRSKGAAYVANQVHTGRYAFKVTNDSGLIIHLPLQDVRSDGFGYVVSAWIYRPFGTSGQGMMVERRRSSHAVVETRAGNYVKQDEYDYGPVDDQWQRWEVRFTNAELIASNLFQPGTPDYLRIWIGTGAPGGNGSNVIYVDDIVCHPDNATFGLTTYDYRGTATSLTDTRHRSSYPQTNYVGNALGISDERYRMFGQGSVNRLGEN